MALFSEAGAEETHATRQARIAIEEDPHPLPPTSYPLPLALTPSPNQARIAIEEDPLVFDDPIFAIEPLSGEIFPGCSSEVTALFRTRTLTLTLITCP